MNYRKVTRHRFARFPSILIITVIAVLMVGAILLAYVQPNALATFSSTGNQNAAVASKSPLFMYVQDMDRIIVLDLQTGRAVHELLLGGEYPSVFLATAPQTGRLIVSSGGNLTVYRVTDWGEESRVSVPRIINYPGYGFSGIAASSDGKYVYVYNYYVKKPSGADYWVSTLNLETGAWVPQKIDIPDCGASQLFPNAPERLYIVCYGSKDVRVIDTVNQMVLQSVHSNPVQPRSGWTVTGAASGTVLNGTIYIVTDNREMHIKNPNTSQADRVLTGASSAVQEMAPGRLAASKLVPFQPVGIDPRGRILFVPSGTADERSTGLASEIVAVDTVSGNIQRTLRPSQPFRWITFAPDGSAAFALFGSEQVIFGNQIARIDLQTGAETVLLKSDHLYPGFVVSP